MILTINGHCIKHADQKIKNDIMCMSLAVKHGKYLKRYSKLFRHIKNINSIR